MVNAGLAILVVSAVAFGGLLIAAAGMEGTGSGNGSDETVAVCDLKGDISGLVRDYNVPLLPKLHDVINWRLQLEKTNCREVDLTPPWWEGLFSVAETQPEDSDVRFTLIEAPTGALVGPGYVEIYVKVYDAAGDFVTEKKFTATTPDGVAEASFNEPLLFKKLAAGEKWTVKVYHAWKPVNEGPAHGPFTFST